MARARGTHQPPLGDARHTHRKGRHTGKGVASRCLKPHTANPAAPGLGSLNLLPISPQFLPERLVPVKVGGEAREPAYFADGSWSLTSQVPLGRDSRFAIPSR